MRTIGVGVWKERAVQTQFPFMLAWLEERCVNLVGCALWCVWAGCVVALCWLRYLGVWWRGCHVLGGVLLGVCLTFRLRWSGSGTDGVVRRWWWHRYSYYYVRYIDSLL
jgi:hypothetical protein